MKKALSMFLMAASALLGQQPQTQTAPIYPVNAKYVQGFGPGYWATAGTGLSLNLTAGTAFCAGSMVTYAGGSLALAASVTNYVYLNTASSCVPAVKTAAFTSSDIPVATVVTGAAAITSIVDDRTFFQQGGSSSFTAAGDLSGSPTSQQVIGVLGKPLPPLASGYPHYNGTAWVFDTPSGTFTAGGDLSGSSTSQQVIGILGKPLPPLASGYPHYNGTAWVFDTPTGGGTASGGSVTYTASTSASSSDAGKLVVMNCAAACSYTLPATQPSTTWYAHVVTVGSVNATIALAATVTYNGASGVPSLTAYMPIEIFADSAVSTGYRGSAPLVAGAGVTLTSSANALTLAASGAGSFSSPDGLWAWDDLIGSFSLNWQNNYSNVYFYYNNGAAVSNGTHPGNVDISGSSGGGFYAFDRARAPTAISLGNLTSSSIVALVEANNGSSFNAFGWLSNDGGLANFQGNSVLFICDSTLFGNSDWWLVIYGGTSGTTTYQADSGVSATTGWHRLEIDTSGSTASFLVDGVSKGSGTAPAVASFPSFVAYGRTSQADLYVDWYAEKFAAARN